MAGATGRIRSADGLWLSMGGAGFELGTDGPGVQRRADAMVLAAS